MSRKVSTDLERSPVGVGIRKVGQWVDFGDFTDGGGADGTFTLNKEVPAGSFVIGSKVTVTEAFVGDTTCVLNIGTSGDDDLFSQATHNIFAAVENSVRGADGAADGAYRGIAAVSTAIGVLLTASGGSDWGAVTAGRMFVEVIYFSTNVELVDTTQTRFDK